jgi:hypothetical protein
MAIKINGMGLVGLRRCTVAGRGALDLRDGAGHCCLVSAENTWVPHPPFGTSGLTEDLSHAEVMNTRPDEELIAEIIAECVHETLYPARPSHTQGTFERITPWVAPSHPEAKNNRGEVRHWRHPLAGRGQASTQFHGGASRQSLIPQLQSPFAAADHARFFTPWLRRIAPDTHQDQANDDDLPPTLAASPPQKNVGTAKCPRGSSQTHGCRFPGANPWLARVAGDPRVLRSVTAPRPPIQTRWLLSRQSPNPGWPVAVETHAKQRATSNGAPSFKMW